VLVNGNSFKLESAIEWLAVMSKNATGKEKFLEKMNTFDSAFE